MKTKNEEILEFIISYIQQHGYSPTVREIGNHMDYSSSSTTYHHLEKMFSKGMIETDDPGSPRSIRVPGYRFVKENRDAE